MATSKVEDFLTPTEEAEIIEAIRVAEKNTSGEIRVHLESTSKIDVFDRATEVFDVLREGLSVALIVSLPVLGVALLVGIVIGLFQALTSIQEMTLTFVPKLAAILAVFWLSMGYSGQLLVNFYKDQVIENITRGF